MGCKVKIQKIERTTNKTYYVNFPGAIADAINLEKGEQMEWFIESRNCFVLKRVKTAGSFRECGKTHAAPKRANTVGKQRRQRSTTGDAD
jgi:hypothetical protein